MLLIHKTVSLCNECYRHIPANVYESDGLIKMSKCCPEHGIMDSIVEIDKDFYYNLQHDRDISSFNQILFEASDRCQLECPHCYHLPDNKTQDVPIDLIISQLDKFPRNSVPMLAGAEATLRPDFIELCSSINTMGFDSFSVLTNGLRFYNKDFAQECYNSGLTSLCLGLNHYSYQGEKVHSKQLEALTNMLDVGFNIGYVGYTIESYDHLTDILNEIKLIDNSKIRHYRIRCGSFIGRSSDIERGYLSKLVQKVTEILGADNIEKMTNVDDNPYHYMIRWGNIEIRLIQWPDVTNIDLEELATGPWCQFYDGPITNFVHQVITRDAFINNNLPMLDTVPQRYQYRLIDESIPTDHWKHNYQGPQQVDTLDYSFDSIETTPGKVKKTIEIKQ